MLNDISLKPLNGQDVKQAVIILHGLGDSASGIIGLAEAFRPAMPNTEFLACDAPYPCDFSPFGYQWFSANDWSHDVVLEGVKQAAGPLNAYIDHVLASRNLEPQRLALVGFSQGTMMSLYVGPRRDKALAGVLGYSGALIGGQELKAERKSAPPIFLAHGTQDEVVPFGSMYRAVEGLRSANISVESVACQGLGHSIDDTGLTQGILFLRKIFAFTTTTINVDEYLNQPQP